MLKQYKFHDTEWFELGIELGIHQPTLAAIEANNKGNVSRCLRECLTKWLNKADEAEPCTWQTLVRALRDIDEKAVADHIDRTSTYIFLC